MLNNLELFRIVSLYIGVIGIVAASINFLTCILLHAIHWYSDVAQRITSILTILAVLSVTLALIGIGAWVWTDGLEASALSELPQWKVEILKMLLFI